MGFRHKPGSPPGRPEVAAPQPTRKQPTAPAVYRPQPSPKVLQTKAPQTKARPAATPPLQTRRTHAPAPPAMTARAGVNPTRPKTADATAAQRPPRLQTAPPALQAKPAQPKPAQPKFAQAKTAQAKSAAVRPVAQRKTGVVQAIRFYPNLHPGAVERVEAGSLFRLESFTDQYRLRKSESHGAYVPNQQYNFVRTGEGQMLLHNRYRHPSIAEGRNVLYAGEVFFNNGRLEWWSNGSGHYQPDAEDAAQAGLPLEQFFSYQQVIKGEHKRRRA